MKRKIVKIDEEKCDGCGLCVPSCAEGAIQIIKGKAKLVSEIYCDGLGACLGHCPEGAITIEEREAEDFNQEAVENHLTKLNKKPTVAHQHPHNLSGCPSSKAMHWAKENTAQVEAKPQLSALSQWPVQLSLVSPLAPYFKNADLLIAADCVPFAYPNFHQEFLKGKSLVIGCPKLDDVSSYQEKLTQLFSSSKPKSVTIVHMEVPCCFGLNHIVNEAVKASGENIPVKEVTVGIRGGIIG